MGVGVNGDTAAPRQRALDWVRRNLFRTWYDGTLTLVFGLGLGTVLVKFYDWAVVNAAFRPAPEACKSAAGACWSVVVDMWPVFLVGLYPVGERWRLVVAVALLIAAAAAVFLGLVRTTRLRGVLWAAVAIAFLVLVHGGVLGLPTVAPQRWGGLLLTVVLAVFSQSIGFPAGILLAIGRRSERRPVIQTVCVVYIELLRSIPLVMILLMATLILPLFLPAWLGLDTTLMAAIGITLFSAASIAEVVRGGLAGVPHGQEEAAASLGLKRSQVMRLIVLPQALRHVQPALIGTFINFTKGSTLVVAIGIYDILGGAVLASSNPDWVGRTVEPLLLVALLFWLICFSLSQYSRRLEQRFASRPDDGSKAGDDGDMEYMEKIA